MTSDGTLRATADPGEAVPTKDLNYIMRWLADPVNEEAFIELVRRKSAEKCAEWMRTRKGAAVEV